MQILIALLIWAAILATILYIVDYVLPKNIKDEQ